MRVKICGITNIEDALVAIEAGADALGFVFYDRSPRFITPDDATSIVRQLPPFVERVGLFVNESKSTIERVCQKSNMSLAQLHFDVDEDFLNSLDIKALPVIRAKRKEDILKFKGRYRLVDAYTQEYGGAGKRVQLEWFDDADREHIILAGGLSPNNVEEVLPYGFYGVDVSSGVEMSKGRKDPQKVNEFIRKVKCEQA